MTQPPRRQEPTQPLAVDPDHVPEVLCDGKLYLTWSGDLGTLTFTHARPKSGPLFGSDRIDIELVVRARVVMTLGNMAALRDLLNDKIKNDGTSTPSGTSGATKH